MGGGRTRSQALSVSSSSVLVDLGGAGLGDAPAIGDGHAFCARSNTIDVAIHAGVALAVGHDVELRLGMPTVVVSSNREVGVVVGALANAISQCLVEGWRLTGKVVSVDYASRTAVARVSGEKG